MGYSPASAIPLNSFGAPTGNIAMASHKFTNLLDGTVALDSAGWDQLPAVGPQFAYVASGCVWTPDAAGSTLVASMSAGTVVIGGLLYSVAAVTSRSFTASNDTYVDINVSAGSAAITYTAVANNTTCPALAGSGTPLNCIRVAIVCAGSSAIAANAINIGWGCVGAGTLGSTTVAAGSNGQAINNLTSTQLVVASATNFPTGGGFIRVAHASGQTYTLKYTGVTGANLTGITSGNVISGTPTNTVSTGDTVNLMAPFGNSAASFGFGDQACITDGIGNKIYPTSPYPNVIGQTQAQNSDTTTLTIAFPCPRFITPFIIPPGPSRRLRITMFWAFLASSATIGTNITIATYQDNAGTPYARVINKVPVASDSGLGNQFQGLVGTANGPSTPPGTYYASCWLTQGAAGTLSFGTIYPSQLTVELVD